MLNRSVFAFTWAAMLRPIYYHDVTSCHGHRLNSEPLNALQDGSDQTVRNAAPTAQLVADASLSGKAGPSSAAGPSATPGLRGTANGRDGDLRRTGRKRKTVERWEPPPVGCGSRARGKRGRSEDVDIMPPRGGSRDRGAGCAAADDTCDLGSDDDDDAEPCASSYTLVPVFTA